MRLGSCLRDGAAPYSHTVSSEKASLDGLKIDRPGERLGSSSPWLIAVVVLVLALLGWGTWWLLRPSVAEVRTATAREVDTGGARTLLNASGYVTPRREATVSSKVTGKVIEVFIEEGLKVTEGQVLARLDDTNVRASLNLAAAQHEAAKAALAETAARIEEASREWTRVSRLATNGIATGADLDHAEAELKSQRARLEKLNSDATVAEKEVALWRQQLEDTTIRAPFAGVVTVKNAQPGEMISPISAGGGFTRTGICTLVDMNSLEIEVDVNESYINRVEAGQPVEAALDAYPDWKMPAKVIAIIPTADRQKATVRVRVGFDKLDPRILPQMGVKVAFHSTGPSGAGTRTVAIPKKAVRTEEGRDTVVVAANGRGERRAVTLGVSKNEDAMVLSGLAAGEKVVTESPHPLKDGEKIREAKP